MPKFKGQLLPGIFNFESLRLLPCITSFVSGLHPKSLRTILVHVLCSAAISLLNKQWQCHSQYAKVEGAQYGCGGHGRSARKFPMFDNWVHYYALPFLATHIIINNIRKSNWTSHYQHKCMSSYHLWPIWTLTTISAGMQ